MPSWRLWSAVSICCSWQEVSFLAIARWCLWWVWGCIVCSFDRWSQNQSTCVSLKWNTIDVRVSTWHAIVIDIRVSTWRDTMKRHFYDEIRYHEITRYCIWPLLAKLGLGFSGFSLVYQQIRFCFYLGAGLVYTISLWASLVYIISVRASLVYIISLWACLVYIISLCPNVTCSNLSQSVLPTSAALTSPLMGRIVHV